MKKLFILFTIIVTALASCKKEKDTELVPVVPTVTTESITNITTISAQGGGNITSDGNAAIIDRGVVWSTAPNPIFGAVGSYNTDDGSGIGTYVSTMTTDITPGTEYYVKAFARNKVGIAYGSEVSFNTLSLSLAIITTDTISNVTNNSATSGGNISSDGGSPVTSRGVCWSTSPNPTILNTITSDGSGIGIFGSSLTSLSSNTLYYVRAYATNSIGTAYGNEVSFTSKLGVGDSYQGGIIAYVLQPGDPGYDANVQHGLIAAPTDQSTDIVWSLTLTTTGATSQALGSGQTNTTIIVTDQGAGSYAAKLCDDLIIGSYSDWYLPSLNELTKLYLNQTAIGGFEVAFYWSSSEDNTNNAWVQSFNSNSQSSGTKTNSNNTHVRAVRSF